MELRKRGFSLFAVTPDYRDDIDYGTVMKVMGEMNAAGFRRIGLVTEPPGGQTKKQK